MHHIINKKILFYFSLFLIFGTLTNKNFKEINLLKIEKININGINLDDDTSLAQNFDYIKLQNLFFLDSYQIHNIMNSNNMIESYSIFKKYPSTLNVNINKTKFLAKVSKNGVIFFLGSNGKLIKSTIINEKIPFLFGDYNFNDFMILKNIIDDSNLNFNEIKNLYFFPSGRWDVEIYSGALIRLPKKQLKKYFDLSVMMLNDQRFKDIKTIDVRQVDQVIIDG